MASRISIDVRLNSKWVRLTAFKWRGQIHKTSENEKTLGTSEVGVAIVLESKNNRYTCKLHLLKFYEAIPKIGGDTKSFWKDFRTTLILWLWARFSKNPETFRARRQILKSQPVEWYHSS